MAKVIDADELLKTIKPLRDLLEKGGAKGEVDVYDNIAYAIERAPCVNIEYPKEGKWIKSRLQTDFWYCSCCMSAPEIIGTPRCPNCGAIMNGGYAEECENE